MACRVMVTVLALVPIDTLSDVASEIFWIYIPRFALTRPGYQSYPCGYACMGRKSDTLPVAHHFRQVSAAAVWLLVEFCSARFQAARKSLALCVIAIEASTSDCWAVRQQSLARGRCGRLRSGVKPRNSFSYRPFPVRYGFAGPSSKSRPAGGHGKSTITAMRYERSFTGKRSGGVAAGGFNEEQLPAWSGWMPSTIIW